MAAAVFHKLLFVHSESCQPSVLSKIGKKLGNFPSIYDEVIILVRTANNGAE